MVDVRRRVTLTVAVTMVVLVSRGAGVRGKHDRRTRHKPCLIYLALIWLNRSQTTQDMIHSLIYTA
jgi:hypothetical protein